MSAPLPLTTAIASSTVSAPKVNPAEALRRKMHRAVLVEKTIFGGGRLGRFVLRVAPSVLGDYQAGQYVGIGLDTPEGFAVRSYSIAGSPLDREALELYIALVPDGRLTPTIFNQEIGSTWYHLTPKGSFTLRKAAARTLVMASTGTGLAPFISQLRTLWRLHQSGVPIAHRIVVIHGVSYADELGYADELRRYAAARSDGFDVTYIPTVSRPDAEGRGWTPALGRGRTDELLRWLAGQPVADESRLALPEGLDRAALAAHGILRDPARSAWLACGNPHMIDSLRDTARQAGIGGFFAEEFWKA